MELLTVTASLAIRMSELRFSFDRSPGPGGQNVNKLNTRAELRFDLAGSPSLSDEQRQRLRAALHARLTADGTLIVRSSRFRSQAQNRQDCLDKLVHLLVRGLRPPPPRRPTRPGRAAQARRLDGKQRQSLKKALRRRPLP